MLQQIIPDDENYVSSEDSDFAPDIALKDVEVSDQDSQPDEDAAESATIKRKNDSTQTDIDKFEIENSGDEIVIAQAKRRVKKKARETQGETCEVEDTERQDRLIKTRSMYALDVSKGERKKSKMTTSPVTIDIDAIWEAMASGKPLPSSITRSEVSPSHSQSVEDSGRETHTQGEIFDEGNNSMITIKRTYNFAGKIHEEEKLVPRDSAEAKLYMATNPNGSAQSKKVENSKRPLRLAYRSMFEPVPENMPKRSDLYISTRKENRMISSGVANQEKKLNTVQKSAIDWANFVDKEGISDELDAAGKSKGAYKARQQFLARVEQKKEEQTRRAKGLA